MNEERLALAKKSFERREKQLALSAQNQSQIANPQSEICDDLGPLATTLEEVEARARAKFGLPPKQRANQPEKTHENLENERSTPDHEEQTTDNSPEEPSSASSPSSAVNNPAEATPGNPQSAIRLPQSIESLEQRVNRYNLARHHEADYGRNSYTVGKWNAKKFKTALLHCPCGHQTLPCPQHGDFPKYFWEMSPDCADYIDILESRGLPFTSPYQLLREQQQRGEEPLNPNLKLNPGTPGNSAPASLSQTSSESPRPIK